MRMLAILVVLATAIPGTAGARDDFDRLADINKASLVMLVERQIVPRQLGRRIADGIAGVVREQAAEGSARSANYLLFEQRLVELAGHEASRLHTGRSRQDIGSTYRRMALRDALLETLGAQLAARDALLELAAAHADTIVPAYTHGVQAQPTSLGHYLLAYSAALDRDTLRLREVYSRLNRSPLGAAALGTSGFRLDRARLAGLLGFDGPIENSYDANLVSSVDSKIEFANALATSAIPIGQLMQNLHTQYHDPRPWIVLSADRTGISSIMPQKRNPRPLDQVRLQASAVVSGAQAVTLNAHNTMSGMNDYRASETVLETAASAGRMYDLLADVLAHLQVDKQRALDEVLADYSTMTEVADVLLREADVPFRIGHHYASELTQYGRTAGRRPTDLGDEDLLRIYESVVGEPLPVEVDRIRQAMDPAAMVAGRRGLGGPQPVEVRRMLHEHRDALVSHRAWLERRRDDLGRARQALGSAFEALRVD